MSAIANQSLANRVQNAIETEKILRQDLQKMKENKKTSKEQKKLQFKQIHIRILQYLLKASKENNHDLEKKIKTLKCPLLF